MDRDRPSARCKSKYTSILRSPVMSKTVQAISLACLAVASSVICIAILKKDAATATVNIIDGISDKGAPCVMVPLEIVLPEVTLGGTKKNLPMENLEKHEKRPTFYVPEGVRNVALSKPVTSSSFTPIVGSLDMITDGDKSGNEGSYVELDPFEQYVTIDLGKEYELYAMCIWHYHKDPVSYYDVVVQTSDDADFTMNVQIHFNNDIDNSLGLGSGGGKHYIETIEGKLIDMKGTRTRYVRMHSTGSNINDMNHYIEVAVYGK